MGLYAKTNEANEQAKLRKALAARIGHGETTFSARVRAVKEAKSKAGNDMVVAALEIVPGDGAALEITYYIANAWRSRNLAEAVAPEFIDRLVELDGPGLQVLVGRSCRVELELETKPQKAEPWVRVTKLLPPERPSPKELAARIGKPTEK